jgi:hypothetical protein
MRLLGSFALIPGRGASVGLARSEARESPVSEDELSLRSSSYSVVLPLMIRGFHILSVTSHCWRDQFDDQFFRLTVCATLYAFGNLRPGRCPAARRGEQPIDEIPQKRLFGLAIGCPRRFRPSDTNRQF